MARWKTGIMSESLTCGVGTTIEKGTKVKFARIKTIADSDGIKLTDYEWHYQPIEGRNYIRSLKRMIEGLPIIKEEYKS
jgi:sugar phosphate isomerase/epimerase